VRILVNQLCGQKMLRFGFFKQAGQYSSHQTEGFFEQTNVELCVCVVYDFEAGTDGLEFLGFD
jgi:hypothetical protein